MSDPSPDPANVYNRARYAERRGDAPSRLRKWSQMRNAAYINADGVVVISRDVYVEQPGQPPAGGAA